MSLCAKPTVMFSVFVAAEQFLAELIIKGSAVYFLNLTR